MFSVIIFGFQAFMREFNVYMVDDVGAASPKVEAVSPTNGQQNMKYYGIPDWMYEGMENVAKKL